MLAGVFDLHASRVCVIVELVKDIEKDSEMKKKLRRREARSLFVLYRANSCEDSCRVTS